MKKIFLILISLCILVFALAITSLAMENVPEVTHTYYLVQSLDSEAAQGKENVVAIDSLIGSTDANAESPFFKQFANGSHVELILAENILTAPASGTGILINTPITVTIKYNGFIHVIDNGANYTGICMRNSNASLRMIGTKAYDLDNGTNYSMTFNWPTGDIGKGNFNLNGCNADAYHYGKVYCWVFAGNVYAENVRSITGQEIVFTEGSASGTYEFKNCVATSKNTAIALQGQSGKTIKIDGGYCSKLTAFSVLTGSYVKNATIDGEVYMDCWSIEDQVWEFTNCTVNKFRTSSGRTHFKLTDCTIKLKDEEKIEGVFSGLGTDGGGACYALVYTSATCDKAGSLTIYKNGSNGLPVSNDSKYPDSMVEEYVAANPPLGHAYIQGELNNNYCPTGVCYDATCSRCDFAGTINWENPSAELIEHNHTTLTDIKYQNGYFEIGTIIYSCTGENCTSTQSESTEKALLVWLGYSASQNGQQMCVGYDIDKDTVAILNTINSKFEIGVCAAVETVIDSKSPLKIDENGNLSALNKTMKADLNEKNVNRIDLIIKGDFANKYATTPMLMSAYVFDGKNLNYAYGTNGSALEIAPVSYTSIAQ